MLLEARNRNWIGNTGVVWKKFTVRADQITHPQ